MHGARMRAKPFSSGGSFAIARGFLSKSKTTSTTLYQSLLARIGSLDIMMDRQTGNNPSFGLLRLVDYLVVIYCVLRILGESQVRNLDEED